MSSAWTDLGGQRRTLARLVYARDRATYGYVCPKCRQPIDWTLPYRDPDTGLVNTKSKSVDHGNEIQDGGSLTDMANLFSAHFGCNSSKGATRKWAKRRELRASIATIAVDPSTV